MKRWNPDPALTRQEEALLKRLKRTRKLFGFLRRHRDELFDDAFQEELESMYRRSGAGKSPVPPALMAMAALLQGYVGSSDAESVELTVVDLRWQMVLGCLGATSPAFSQGAFYDFRHRFIGADMDRRLLERTAEIARASGEFDARKLPRSLRVAMDSSPLVGAGRVEDTINLLAHAACKVVRCASALLALPFEQVCHDAGIPLLLASSVKAGLDRQWTATGEREAALTELTGQLDSLRSWLDTRLEQQTGSPPLKELLATLQQIREQDVEPDPEGGGSRIREGVAPDRRVSVEDGDMRHGRKSSSRRFDGYKRHIANEVGTGIVLACAITPANHPEHEAVAGLRDDIVRQAASISELFIDRGYVSSPVVHELRDAGSAIRCRPHALPETGLFTKRDFRIDLSEMTATCPEGQTRPIELGRRVKFPAAACAACAKRAQCTKAKPSSGRSIYVAEDEHLQQELRAEAATAAGRARLRERVVVEHGLARIGQRQGHRARYVGTRSNLYDLRRSAAIQNLEIAQRKAA